MADSELLSQDEIDALLSGVDSGEVETETDDTVDPGDGAVYDFTSQDRIVRGRMPTLELINERFARNFRQSIFSLLRRPPTISVEGVQLIKFGEYVHTLLVPSNLNIVQIKPLKGSALVVCNPKLVFSVVDCFFGGEGHFNNKIEGRDFTATEMRIVRKVLDLIFADFKEAWEPVLSVAFEYMNSEVNPQFANIVTPSEVVVVSTFLVDLEAGSDYLHVVLPYSMVEPIKSLLEAGVQGDVSEKDERWSTILQEEIKTAKISIMTTLTQAELTLGEVLNFEPGYIFSVELPQTVVARVEDVPVFTAAYGISRGKLALKVVESLNHSELMPQGVDLELGSMT